ncbi:hypothetical protein HK099_004716 [Clydaea vesicula]|uniref:Uncharacterized protein n=1 Tax=Clydaea vesicula TaxID=447962 RepID=A0AAD5U0F1_9FUNG|nr:hypothetical protein HK099_004716 [Clydaea vesicula]
MSVVNETQPVMESENESQVVKLPELSKQKVDFVEEDSFSKALTLADLSILGAANRLEDSTKSFLPSHHLKSKFAQEFIINPKLKKNLQQVKSLKNLTTSLNAKINFLTKKNIIQDEQVNNNELKNDEFNSNSISDVNFVQSEDQKDFLKSSKKNSVVRFKTQEDFKEDETFSKNLNLNSVCLNQKNLIALRLEEAINVHKSTVNFLELDYNTKSEKYLKDFNLNWSQQFEDISSGMVTLQHQADLVNLGFETLQKINEVEAEIFEERKVLISNLELNLEKLEKEKIFKIGQSLIELGKSIKKIKWDVPSFAMRTVQEESVEVNKQSVQTRKRILEYCSAFKVVNVEIHKQFELDEFKIELKKVSERDISNLIESNQSLLNDISLSESKQIESISKINFENLTKEWLQDWRNESELLSKTQEGIVSDFKKNLSEFEESFEMDCNNLVKKFYKDLLECQVHNNHILEKILKDECAKYKRNSEVLAAKRAVMILPTQMARNYDTLMLIGDLLLCIIETKEDGMIILKEIDLDTEERLANLKYISDNQLKNMDDTLELIKTYINSSEEEEQVVKYKEKCVETLSEVEEAQKKINLVGVELIQSLNEKTKVALDLYKEKMFEILGIKEQNSEKKLKESEDNNEKTVELSNFNFCKVENELEFLARKILEFYQVTVNIAQPLSPPSEHSNNASNVQPQQKEIMGKISEKLENIKPASEAEIVTSIAAADAMEEAKSLESNNLVLAGDSALLSTVAASEVVDALTAMSKQLTELKESFNNTEISEPAIVKVFSEVNLLSKSAAIAPPIEIVKSVSNILNEIQNLENCLNENSEEKKLCVELKEKIKKSLSKINLQEEKVLVGEEVVYENLEKKSDGDANSLTEISNKANEENNKNSNDEDQKNIEENQTFPIFFEPLKDLQTVTLVQNKSLKSKIGSERSLNFNAFHLQSIQSIASNSSLKLTESQSKNKSNDHDLLISMKPIENFQIEKFRVSLQKAVIFGYHNWQKDIINSLPLNIKKLELRLRKEYTTIFFKFEGYWRSIEEIHKMRINDIKCLKGNQKNQVKIFEKKFSLIKNTYEENFINLIKKNLIKSNIENFLKVLILPVSNTSSLKSLIAKLDKLVVDHQDELNTLKIQSDAKFNKCLQAFKDLKSNTDPKKAWLKKVWKLLEEKNLNFFAGNTTSVTNVNIETGSRDPIFNLEYWKNFNDSKIVKFEEEVKEFYDKTRVELLSHFSDLELIEKSKSYVQSFRLKIQADYLIEKNKSKEIESLLSNHIIQQKDDNNEFIQIYDLVTSMEVFRQNLVSYGQFLNCLKSGNSNFVVQIPEFESWIEARKIEIQMNSNPSSKQSSNPITRSNSFKPRTSESTNRLSSSTFSLAKIKKNSVILEEKKTFVLESKNYISNNFVGENFSQLIENSKLSFKEKIFNSCQSYYKKNFICKPNLKIPENINELLTQSDVKLNSLQNDGEKKRAVWVDEMLIKIVNSTKIFFDTFKIIYKIILHESLNDMEANWISIGTWYLEQTDRFEDSKKELERLLKLKIGHPNFKEDLDYVEKLYITRNTKFDNTIKEFKKTLKKKLEDILFDILLKLDYTTFILIEVGNLMLDSGDILKPDFEDQFKKIPLQELLKKRKLKKLNLSTNLKENEVEKKSSLSESNSSFSSETNEVFSSADCNEKMGINQNKDFIEFKNLLNQENFNFEIDEVNFDVFNSEAEIIKSRRNEINEEILRLREEVKKTFLGEFEKKINLLEKKTATEINTEEEFRNTFTFNMKSVVHFFK